MSTNANTDAMTNAIRGANTIWTYNGIDIEVRDVGSADGVLQCTAIASIGGVTIDIDNPLMYVNPPLFIKDGTEVVPNPDYVAGSPSNGEPETITIPTFKRDPISAFQVIVGETVESFI